MPKDKAQCNFTDPESRIIKTSQHGFQQAYNALTVVESELQLIVETCVTNEAVDQKQLLPMASAVKETYSQQPDKVLAGAGYCSEANLAGLASRGVDGYVALGREGRKAVSVNPKTRPLTAQMQAKLATPKGRAMYAQRKWLSEAPMGGSRTFLAFADSVSGARPSWPTTTRPARMTKLAYGRTTMYLESLYHTRCAQRDGTVSTFRNH